MWLHHVRSIFIETDDFIQVWIGGAAGVLVAWNSTIEQRLASLVTVAMSRYGSVALVSTKIICYVNLGSVACTLNATVTVN